MNYFYAMKKKDYLWLFRIIATGCGWMLIDQYLFSDDIRQGIALFMVWLILFYIQFAVTDPRYIIRYANSLIGIVSIADLIAISVAVLFWKPNFSPLTILTFLFPVIIPYFSGFIYYEAKKHNSSSSW
jgi:hypothetical protein